MPGQYRICALPAHITHSPQHSDTAELRGNWARCGRARAARCAAAVVAGDVLLEGAEDAVGWEELGAGRLREGWLSDGRRLKDEALDVEEG